jgi:hypothetical protein
VWVDGQAGPPRGAGGTQGDARPALLGLISGYRISQAVYVAAKLGIADLLRDGPRGDEELAEATGTHARSLYRVLRALAGIGILAEGEGRRFALEAPGDLLRSDAAGSLRSLAILSGQDPHWRVWGQLLHSVRTGEQVFDHTFGVPDLFAYLAEHPEDAAVFNESMIALTAEVAPAVAAAYDFSGIGTLVDVGGGRGHALVPILRAYPGMRAVLFDRPRVVESAKRLLAEAGVADRCELVGGDFFESVPSGDAYLLKHVVHDWDDERNRVILGNCRRAMGPSGRLLLVERDLPTDNRRALPALLSDLSMMIQLGGGERTEAEYRALLAGAGFVLTRTVATPLGESVLEARPVT